MYAKICPVCKNKFYTESNYSVAESALHNYCIEDKKLKNKNKQRQTRTSTPIAELENRTSYNPSDSVTDFFYQSWKSGLHSDGSRINRMPANQWNYQPYGVLQPICYVPQIAYVNTLILQSYVPFSCTQQVGYRSDGTFGVLSTYWT